MYAFLLVLTRVGGVFVFVPLPGTHAGPTVARTVASLGCTLALFSRWPVIQAESVTPGLLVAWILSEAALGMIAGLVIGFVAEALLMGAQILSLQAGYAYASVIDPNTQADSGVLLIVAQLLGGMLFFALGLDAHILKALAASLASWPPGKFSLSAPMAAEVVKVAGNLFVVGFRIALPITGLLIMVDLALGVLGRIHSQLQVTLLAFPLKMIVGLLMLGWILVLFPRIFEGYALQGLVVIRGILAH